MFGQCKTVGAPDLTQDTSSSMCKRCTLDQAAMSKTSQRAKQNGNSSQETCRPRKSHDTNN